MSEADAIEFLRNAMWVVLIASGPAVGVGMVVGIVISLLQALTQVQEITLTFVPKIVLILLTVSFSATFIGAQLMTFSGTVYERIATGI